MPARFIGMGPIRGLVLGLLAFATPSAVVADTTTYKVKATNNTGRKVDDFEPIFSGTGGSITNEKVTKNADMAGKANITVKNDNIVITWDAPGLPDKGKFEFQFDSLGKEVAFEFGKWTLLTGPNDVQLGQVPNMANTWEVSATNQAGGPVDGLIASFTGTGGSIIDPQIITNPTGAGDATIASLGDLIVIDWLSPGLPLGETVVFRFATGAGPVGLELAEWTLGVDPVRDEIVVTVIPEPGSALPLALGLLGLISVLGRGRCAGPSLAPPGPRSPGPAMEG